MDRIIGRKLGMTQLFEEDGRMIPVTVVELVPCVVVQKKVKEKDGYYAVQVGSFDQNPKRVKKPLRGHFEKAGVPPKRILKELPVSEEEINNIEVGQEIKPEEIFEVGDFVDVTGITKGRGFTGVIKRHNFSGFGDSHGTHEYKRHAGSIGMHTYPGRVLKGHKMAGHYGNEKVTVLNMRLVRIDRERRLFFINGAVPGPSNGIVLVRKAIKKKGKIKK